MQDAKRFHDATTRLRKIFVERGFIEVPVQSRLSILAACEDPYTVSVFTFAGRTWPLPQTGQMWLEYELLTHPRWPGVFCASTSYRNEPRPIPGRHDLVFPMFEFEAQGDVADLVALEKELVHDLGMGEPRTMEYDEVCGKYGSAAVGAREEELLEREYGCPIVLTRFPFRSHPFWNMKEIGDRLFNKVDVILHGMETIGSAERSCNPDEMRANFHGVSHGKYAEKLFELFGRERVMRELDAYLALEMFPRFGGGIGVTRLARALGLEEEKGVRNERFAMT
ncbi:MAG: transposase [bacterium]|nr:transposase [bacterium]